MRLRQIAIACHDVDAVAADLAAVFGLKVAYRDPRIIHYGLANAVLPAGAAFIEVLAPVRPDASAARFLARRGGDAGYMLIIQVADAAKERTRIQGLGVRVVDDIDGPAYRAAHFHPNDFGGVLVSVDEQRAAKDHLEPLGDWAPAGPDWRAARTPEVLDIASATLASADPDALAKRFSALLARPLDGARRLPLDRGELRFASGDAAATVIRDIELKVADPAAALARAERAGLEVSGGGVRIGGVLFIPLG
ncbi:MAG: VOC family protein [Caulobacteraceae bacterium]